MRESGYLFWFVSMLLGLNRFKQRPRPPASDFQLRCHDRHLESMHIPRLVVFDFDETLTIHTWLPHDERFDRVIGHELEGELATRVVDESFGMATGRLDRLRRLLTELARGGDGGPRPLLAVLTRNENGAIAVLNILRLAGLSRFFRVIWRINMLGAQAVYRTEAHGRETWQSMPVLDAMWRFDSKAETIRKIVANPSAFFPLSRDSSLLANLAEEEVVLIDDDPDNLVGVRRYCKVATFPREQGNRVGGIGYKHKGDFKTLLEFVKFLQQKAEHPNLYKALWWFGR